MTINLNSESDTPASPPLPPNPKSNNTCFDNHDRAIPRGLTTIESLLMGGTMILATFSAFVTPMDFGKSSTKNRVIAVSTTAPHLSPLAPKTDAARWEKIVVAANTRWIEFSLNMRIELEDELAIVLYSLVADHLHQLMHTQLIHD
jgi:hypothetical protein